jgi:hypothetical protein
MLCWVTLNTLAHPTGGRENETLGQAHLWFLRTLRPSSVLLDPFIPVFQKVLNNYISVNYIKHITEF